MKDNTRRKQDKFEREQAFLVERAADFLAGSPGAIVMAEKAALIAEMNGLSATQVSETAEAAQALSNKNDGFDDLMAMIRAMNNAANAFEFEVPGSDLLFRLPRDRSEQNLLATGRAFHQDSASPLQIKFVDYGLAATFRDDLQDIIDAVEAALAAVDTSNIQRASAVSGLDDAARRGVILSRRANAIVKIKYQDQPQVLGARTVASHLERAPKSNTPPPPPPPTP